MGNPQKSGRDTEAEKIAGPGRAGKSSEAPGPAGCIGSAAKEGDWKGQISASDAAGYVHDMAVELKGLAESAKLTFLAYLLALVIEESAVQKRGGL